MERMNHIEFWDLDDCEVSPIPDDDLYDFGGYNDFDFVEEEVIDDVIGRAHIVHCNRNRVQGYNFLNDLYK